MWAVHRRILDQGIHPTVPSTVLAQAWRGGPQPQLSRAHVALYVRVGSRFENEKTNGLSHFLEHMIYRGTARLPSAHAVNYEFEKLGGYLYAATQTDFGIFSVTLPPESLDQASALFGEVLRAPSFFDIEVEKGIVCEEILEDLDDEGRQVDADNLSRALIYPHHPLGYTITGDEARVRSFDRTMLLDHHARHYTAANSVLAFSGNIDAARVMALAARDFDALKAGKFELIIHCAAQPSHDWAASEPFTDFDTNARGTLNILEAVRLHAPDAALVHMSTNKVYGDRPNTLPLVELESRFELAPALPDRRR